MGKLVLRTSSADVLFPRAKVGIFFKFLGVMLVFVLWDGVSPLVPFGASVEPIRELALLCSFFFILHSFQKFVGGWDGNIDWIV